MKLTRLRADGILLLTAMIWGTGFVAQKGAVDHMAAPLFLGGRFLLSALMVAPLAWRDWRASGQAGQKIDIRLAVLIGLCLMFGNGLQQYALSTTSVTNAGFLTALYMAFVPFVERMMTGRSLRPVALIACTLALIGAWLLSGGVSLSHFSTGDMLLVIGAVIWAFHITLINRFQAHYQRPYVLSIIQYLVTACGGLGFGLLFYGIPHHSDMIAVIPGLFYAGIISGGLAFTLQIIAQRYTPPAEASIIMATEGVFAALAGSVFMGDYLTTSGIIGCILIMVGVLLVELWPTQNKLAVPL